MKSPAPGRAASEEPGRTTAAGSLQLRRPPPNIAPDEAPTGAAEAINEIYEGLLDMLQEVRVVAEDLPEQGEDERDISLLKRLLTDKKYQFMFLDPARDVSCI